MSLHRYTLQSPSYLWPWQNLLSNGYWVDHDQVTSSHKSGRANNHYLTQFPSTKDYTQHKNNCANNMIDLMMYLERK